MNYRIVGKYLSYLLFAEAVFFVPSIIVCIIYREYSIIPAFLFSMLICLIIFLVLFLFCRKEQATIYPRESFVVAGSGWVLVSLLGALPFLFSGEVPNYIDALFESVSGFTTTGASVLSDVESMSRGLLFWRSFSQWLGGIGILVFILTIVRAQKGSAGSSLNLYRAETTGPQVGKIMPKTRESVQILYTIYISLSAICLVFLLAGGMPIFDALCTMFGTAGTGGFGIQGDSLASYSPYIQNICTIFMVIFGVNFTLYYFLVKRDWKSVLKDQELRLYLIIFFGFVIAIFLILFFTGWGGAGESFHHSAFTVSSILTTSGFSSVDYNAWPQIARSLILILMVFGAMAGSTAGGFKTIRILVLLKAIRTGLYRLTHPRSVRAVRVNGKVVEDEVVQGIFLFIAIYCCIFAISFILISFDGFSLETNISAVVSCTNNVGPALGEAGPLSSYANFSYFSKIILSLNMLLGRLEIFPILLMLSPATWKRKQ